jgi:hypothetical protein
MTLAATLTISCNLFLQILFCIPYPPWANGPAAFRQLTDIVLAERLQCTVFLKSHKCIPMMMKPVAYLRDHK